MFDHLNVVATSVFVFFFAAVTILGFLASQWKAGDLGHIAEQSRVHIAVEAETIREFTGRRVAQNRLTVADENWNISDADAESVQQGLGAFICIQIHVVAWMTVPSKKLPKTNRVRGMARSDMTHINMWVDSGIRDTKSQNVS